MDDTYVLLIPCNITISNEGIPRILKIKEGLVRLICLVVLFFHALTVVSRHDSIFFYGL